MCKEIINKHMNGKLSASNKEYIYNNKKYTGAVFKIELNLDK